MPGCHSALAVTSTVRAGSSVSARSISASASWTACASIAWRSRFSRSRSAAIRAASLGSAVVSRRAPSAESPMRPPALMRGPRTKPRCQASGGSPSEAASSSAASPVRPRWRITVRPWVTKARLRPVRGTTSATVARATRSRASVSCGSGRWPPKKPSCRRARFSATRVRNTMPAAQRWPRPERSSRRFGLTTARAGGSTSEAAWWSRTMTSRPDFSASSRGAWPLVPQSTQTRSVAPSAASAVIAAMLGP